MFRGFLQQPFLIFLHEKNKKRPSRSTSAWALFGNGLDKPCGECSSNQSANALLRTITLRSGDTLTQGDKITPADGRLSGYALT
ncbi:hypothetical protein CV632_03015 [Geobacillus thermodenitrificans]|nr:hypothetical protein [Geobacillus thermodenitrificans]PJW22308.1 hypothetical protein CV632_03015 [Geobacillus thermodenitrificans]